jgi:hypothetical protein
MIVKLLLKAPNASMRLVSPDGHEIPANEAGEFDISEFPNLAAQYPTWELKRVED